ncbi:MAG: hypothetical protein ACR2HQ_02230 [Ilumatobacteraceae bacterium]
MEMRLRDVGTQYSPLTGMAGRFVLEDQAQAFHPGPLGWFAMWPPYRLLGSSSWALLFAQVLLGFIALVIVFWIVARRADPTRLVIAGVVVVLTARAYGIVILSEVWNTHLPLLWWLVCVFATWAVVIGDRPLIVVAIGAGSLGAQSYAGYLIPFCALLVLAFAALFVDILRYPSRRWRSVAWLSVGVAAVAAFWAPAIYEELTNDPGNLSLLWEFATAGLEEPIGWAEGLDVVLLHLDPWRLVGGELWGDRQSGVGVFPTGSATPGLVLLIVWATSFVASWRIGDRNLRRFHVVVAVTLLAAIGSASRIVAPVWYWTVLYLWVTQAVILVAVSWTIAAACARAGARRRHVVRAGLLAVTMLVAVVWVGETLVGPRLADHPQSQVLAGLVPRAVDSLRSGTVPGGGVEGRYLVRWSEPAAIGTGFGFLDELERAGFEVIADELHVAQVWPHRVGRPDDPPVTAIVELVGGAAIARRLALPGAVQVAYTDLRTDDERTRFNALRSELINRVAPDLDLLRAIDDNFVAIMFRTDLDPEVIALAIEMVDIGVPMAVVVRPPEAPQPG